MRIVRRVAYGAAAAVAAAAVVAGVAIGTAAAAPRDIGVVAWTVATAASRADRSVTVVADVRGVERRRCDLLIGRPRLQESATTIRVRLAVSARPGRQGRVCSLQPQSRLVATVQLAEPIGSRTLVDAVDGGTRPLRLGTPG